MNSRELIKQVITFDAAPRIGYHLPEPWPCDVVHAGVDDDPAFEPRRWTEGDTEFWTDEWGCAWQRLGGISKGEVAEGALADWADLGAYRPPDYRLDARYDRAREVFARADGKYRIGDIPGCAFNISRKIRRIDRFLMDCLLEPDRVRALNAAVMDQLLTAVRRLAAAGADAVMYPEDWGTQDRLLMAPETFRALFLPEIERLCAAASDVGVDVWMHSCGNIWDIIDDLRGAGVKVLQFDQPTLQGVDRLNEVFGGRMTFECPVDIQSSVAGLQSRNREVIRAEARRLVETLGSHGGGFIACRYLDEVAIGMESPEWQDAACEAFVEFGGWAQAPDETVEA